MTDPALSAVDQLAKIEGADGSRPALEFLSVRDLAERVRAAGPQSFLLRGVFPEGDYGVLGGEFKSQKSWDMLDLAVAVSSGTPWLGHVPVDAPGPVLAFCGEGGARNIMRRIEALAASRGLVAEDLPLTICTRAPHLSDEHHLDLMIAQIGLLRPNLVTLDPLYLAVQGADMASLYKMGALLERMQHLCEDAGASLLVATHQNRKEGRGAGRILGAGPAEWGRVLISKTVIARHTDPKSKASDVLTELDIIGGEIADRTLRLRRRIWADTPDELDSTLHLEQTVEEVDAPNASSNEKRLAPATRKLLEAVEARGPAISSELVDWIAGRYGHGLKRETVSRNLNELERLGRVESTDQGSFKPKLWTLVEANDEAPV